MDVMDVPQDSERQKKGPPPSYDRNASLMNHSSPNQNMAIGHSNSKGYGTRPIPDGHPTNPTYLINISPPIFLPRHLPRHPNPPAPSRTQNKQQTHIPIPSKPTNHQHPPHPQAPRQEWGLADPRHSHPSTSPTTSHPSPLFPVQQCSVVQCSAVQCTTDSQSLAHIHSSFQRSGRRPHFGPNPPEPSPSQKTAPPRPGNKVTDIPGASHRRYRALATSWVFLRLHVSMSGPWDG
jgi:hypothetical protein